MNEIVNNYLLYGAKFMSEIDFKQPGLIYFASGSFAKNKKRIEQLIQTGNTDFIYKNELDRACFQHDMTNGKQLKTIQQKEVNQFQKITHLKLQVTQNMIVIKEDQLQWFTSFW